MLGNLKIVTNGAPARQTAPARRPAQHVVQAAFHVYHALGGGLDVDVYRQCFAEELRQAGMVVARDVPLALSYRDLTVAQAATVDFIVGDDIPVLIRAGGESKELELVLRSVMRLAAKKEGYLFNFRVPDIRKGIIHAKVV